MDLSESSGSRHASQGVPVGEHDSADFEPSWDDDIEMTGLEPWDMLKLSLQRLEVNPCISPSFKVVVTELLGCLPYFRMASDKLIGVNQLPQDLATRIAAINNYTQTFRPGGTFAMSGCAKNHIREIHQQITLVDEHRQNSSPDPRYLLQCYTYISAIFRKLEIEVEFGAWRICNPLCQDSYLQVLAPAQDAIYNTTSLRGWRCGCAPNTRTEVMTGIKSWIHDPNAPSVYWVYGDSEIGKTTIAYTSCEELDADDQLAASFFASKMLPNCQDVRRVIPTIAYQFARFSYSFESCLGRILRKNPGIKPDSMHMETQFKVLMWNPLMEIVASLPSRLVVVLDALEDCGNNSWTCQFLQRLFCQLPIRCMVTGASMAAMALRHSLLPRRMCLHYLDRSDLSVQQDIAILFKHELKELLLKHDNIQLLTALAEGSFVYATTCVRYLRSILCDGSREVRLHQVMKALKGRPNDNQTPLDRLYAAILASALEDPQANLQKSMVALQVLLNMSASTNVDVLEKLVDQDSAVSLLKYFSSVICVSPDGNTISIVHPSFHNFMLLYYHRSGAIGQGFDENQQCTMLASRCLSIMHHTLRFNVYQLDLSYGLDSDEPVDLGPARHTIPAEVLFACRFWGGCVESAKPSEDLLSELHDFLSCNLLHWIEVLNQNACITEGVLSLSKVEGWLLARSAPLEILELVQDARRFVMSFSDCSTLSSTTSLYITALPTWPATSPVSKCYQRGIRSIIHSSGALPGGKDPALLSTWPTGSVVRSVSISLDGTRVLSNSTSFVARAWDLDNGSNVDIMDRLRHDFQGRPRPTSLAFSPDGGKIALGSSGPSITVWDVRDASASDAAVGEHGGTVNSVVFSSDGKLVASGSDDCTVQVWTIQKSESTLRTATYFQYAKQARILSVAFSPDGSLVASGSNDCKIYVMSSRDSSIGIWLAGHTSSVNSVAFAPNSNLHYGAWNCGKSAVHCSHNIRIQPAEILQKP